MSKRKSIGKRLRFDIFKRDGFRCQYCGAHPPKAVLEVDHIVPVAKGGENDADNLITACFNCNRGKADIGLGVVPQSLEAKANETAEREEQLKGYNAILQAKRDRIEEDVWNVVDHWTGEDSTTNERYAAIKRFVQRIGLHETLDAVDITLAANVRGQKRQLLYFCKVCWNKVTALEDPQ